MDYETKILLNKLIKAVNSPDWWVIGITIVNALIVIGLTIWQLCLNRRQTQIQERQNELQENQVRLQSQQNELQKRQIETQEYEMYRRLYIVVSEANYEIRSFLYNVWSALWAPTYRVDKDYLHKRIEIIEKVQKEFYQNNIDFELKFSVEFFDRGGYDKLLSYMVNIYKHMENHLLNNRIPLCEGTHTMHYDSSKGDDSYVTAIMSHMPTTEMMDLYYLYLSEFIELKGKIYNAEAPNTIKKRCKID